MLKKFNVSTETVVNYRTCTLIVFMVMLAVHDRTTDGVHADGLSTTIGTDARHRCRRKFALLYHLLCSTSGKCYVAAVYFYLFIVSSLLLKLNPWCIVSGECVKGENFDHSQSNRVLTKFLKDVCDMSVQRYCYCGLLSCAADVNRSKRRPFQDQVLMAGPGDYTNRCSTYMQSPAK